MNEQLKRVLESKKTLAGIGAVAANLPGVTLIAANVLILPNDTKSVYIGLQAALTAVILMVLFIKGGTIRQTDHSIIIRRAKVSFAGFFITITLYSCLYYIYVQGNYVFPFFPTGHLKDVLDNYGGVSATYRQYGEGSQDLLADSTTEIAITHIIFWVMYASFIGFLVYSLAILTVYLGAPNNEPNKAKPSKETEPAKKKSQRNSNTPAV